MEHDVLTVNEVAKYLRIDQLTVRRMIKSGKLKAVVLAGTTLRILKTEVEKISV